MIYLDSAAVVKLVRQEENSADLVAWLNAQDDAPLVSSTLVRSGPVRKFWTGVELGRRCSTRK